MLRDASADAFNWEILNKSYSFCELDHEIYYILIYII